MSLVASVSGRSDTGFKRPHVNGVSCCLYISWLSSRNVARIVRKLEGRLEEQEERAIAWW